MKQKRALKVLISVLTSLILILSMVPSAYAVTSTEKKAEAKRVQSEINELNMKLEAATEDYNDAEEAHDEAVELLEQTEEDIATTDDKIAALTERLSDRAVSMYRNGTITIFDALFGISSFSDFLTFWDYLQRLNENDATLIEDLDEAQDKLQSLKAQYTAAEAEAAEQVEIMAEKKEEIESSLDALNAKLDTINDEILELIAQEEAAAQKAAEEAALAAAAKAAEESSSGKSTSDEDENGVTIYKYNTTTSGARNTVVNTALAQCGKWYVYGAAGPNTFDCSGLVLYCYRKVGIYLAHGSRPQYRSGTPVSKANLKPGDLVFFYGGSAAYNTHVGIYIGNGNFVHAPCSGQQVQVSSLESSYWKSVYVGGCRILS